MIPASAVSLIPERNFLVRLEYDGTPFQGWQVQPDVPTIQGALETALSRMTGQAVVVAGSGRTDAGVHARGQAASFQCQVRFGPDAFVRGLNSLLPDAIAVIECREVPLSFHARFSAIAKTYVYQIRNHPIRSALSRQTAWHRPVLLDVAAMQTAADHLMGTHDFASFEATGSPRSSTVRTLTRAVWSTDGDDLLFTITGDGFLRYMVRNIVGTLEWVGNGRLSPDALPDIIAAENRTAAGPTAPAHGLYLQDVVYPDAVFTLPP
ncbi:MAG: tRNA pseudouridine(38-40) synthase TruA [Deltaproteobacteria bacterium]|nr:MAG: tRNA pseudouridine(38-40) synthase TruA [Deltaproteobacteria bacterium]